MPADVDDDLSYANVSLFAKSFSKSLIVFLHYY